MSGNENSLRQFKAVYEDPHMFTVFWQGKEVAWCQWSPLYSLWRVLMVETGELHHIQEQKEIFDVCAAFLGFDYVDNVEIEA